MSMGKGDEGSGDYIYDRRDQDERSNSVDQVVTNHVV